MQSSPCCAEQVEQYSLPVRIAGELRTYQRTGINWLNFLRTCGLHGVLADDMGLGKTLQTCAVVSGDLMLQHAHGPAACCSSLWPSVQGVSATPAPCKCKSMYACSCACGGQSCRPGAQTQPGGVPVDPGAALAPRDGAVCQLRRPAHRAVRGPSCSSQAAPGMPCSLPQVHGAMMPRVL